MKLDALLVAHSCVRVERPPELWEAETDDERLLPLLGEMLASPLSRGAVLSDLTLNVSNKLEEPIVAYYTTLEFCHRQVPAQRAECMARAATLGAGARELFAQP